MGSRSRGSAFRGLTATEVHRRTFLTMLVLAVPLAAEVQPVVKVWRIRYLTPADAPRATLMTALRERGYVEGQTIRFEVRCLRSRRCGGRLRLLATILDPRVISAVLGALAVESETVDRVRPAPVG